MLGKHNAGILLIFFLTFIFLFSLIIYYLVRFNTNNKHHFQAYVDTYNTINNQNRKEKILKFTQFEAGDFLNIFLRFWVF